MEVRNRFGWSDFGWDFAVDKLRSVGVANVGHVRISFLGRLNWIGIITNSMFSQDHETIPTVRGYVDNS